MKRFLPFLIFVAVLVASYFLPASDTVKVIVVLADLLALFWMRRYYLAFTRAQEHLRKGRYEKAVAQFEKAAKGNLGDDATLEIVNSLIMIGPLDEAEAILAKNRSGKHKNPNYEPTDLLLQGLIAYRKGDVKGALGKTLEAKATGFKSVALYGNLMTLYLDDGNPGEARKIYEEADEKMRNDVNVLDPYGRLCIVQGKWDDAFVAYGRIISSHIESATTYLNTAVVFNHYGMAKEALVCLDQVGGCFVGKLCRFSKEFVADVAKKYRDSAQRLALAHAIDEDPSALIQGRMPAIGPKTYPPCSEDRNPGFGSLPVNLRKYLAHPEGDDVTPDTDITEEDEEYMKTHGGEDA